MATQILATADTAANSADMVVAAGAAVTIGLKSAASGALVRVQIKDDEGNYLTIDPALTDIKPVTVIASPGTYRFQRAAGAACGVFSG
ncbi:hypothetical protein [Rhizobium binae]|uniref:hypothetical protein n=1 Tax=Rhizobium binae TaxID=1138190 RepID=UPI001C833ADC|nr:hypothetical protein [Rhizobium binae]MBX4944652.1 hypothetical protein [Rhizobium binae]MBX4980683.1 hypothetical protein [Rhizobium binae]